VKNDPKSAELVVLKQQVSLALGLSLKYLQREHEDMYAQLYDTEAEVEALEIEYNRLHKLMKHKKKERLELVQETNALLTTRLEVERMRVNTEVQLKARLEQRHAWSSAGAPTPMLKVWRHLSTVKVLCKVNFEFLGQFFTSC
jgi:hypothetical protein